MALLICSLLMGLQSVPGIIKPYSKGVVQFLTKVPEKQKSKAGEGAGAESFPFSSTNYDRTL